MSAESTSSLRFSDDLRQALQHYKAEADAEQRAAASRMLELLASTGGEPTSRKHFLPGHFTCSGIVASPDGQRVLLIAHRKLALWLQPGGHIEASDLNFIQAAEREVREETKIEQLQVAAPIFDLDIHEIPALGSEPAHLHFDVRVLFSAELAEPGGDLSAEEKARVFLVSEVLAAGEELADGLPTDKSVRRLCSRLEQRKC